LKTPEPHCQTIATDSPMRPLLSSTIILKFSPITSELVGVKLNNINYKFICIVNNCKMRCSTGRFKEESFSSIDRQFSAGNAMHRARIGPFRAKKTGRTRQVDLCQAGGRVSLHRARQIVPRRTGGRADGRISLHRARQIIPCRAGH
jgi:hypothetical protein